MEEEATLIRKRGSIKAKLTHFSRFVQDLVEKDDPTEKELEQLNNRIERANAILSDFDDVQTQLEMVASEPEEYYDDREAFESSFYEIVSEAKLLLRQYSNKDDNRSLSSGADQPPKLEVNHQYKHAIKLPEIKLPTFSGQFESWMEYRDTFTSVIHENDEISNVQKFHYLKASLEGAALSCIQSLPISADMYALAWERLCNRFNDKKRLVDYHLESIFSIDKIHKVSASKIRYILDTIPKHLKALEMLEQKTDGWDVIIIHFVTKILDDVSLSRWQEVISLQENINLKMLYDFLTKRADLLETFERKRKPLEQSEKRVPNRSKGLLTANVEEQVCLFCNNNHKLYMCSKFKNASLKDRLEFVKDKRLCNNCLRGGHTIKGCRLYGTCKVCGSKHNTLLHKDTKAVDDRATDSSSDQSSASANSQSSNAVNSSVSLAAKYNMREHVLLSTAVVNVYNQNKLHQVRLLLDSGSQACFITEGLCHRLNLDMTKVNCAVSGLSSNICAVKHKVEVMIHSRVNDYKFQVTCLVLPEITGETPSNKIDTTDFGIPKGLRLADPTFHIPGGVELLLGADVFWNILSAGRIQLGKQKPMLQATKLGWIAVGRAWEYDAKQLTCNISQNIIPDVQQQLERFFELESVSEKSPWSQEEILCDKHFVENTKRLSDGRFEVRIPFKQSANILGDSLEHATTRFLSLERKLERNPQLNVKYKEFMLEYERLGHMTKCDSESNAHLASNGYIMPHHGVLREQSITTKLRVVFDASASTSTGVSLNDLQMVGPTIQDDLLSILLRFRQHSIVFTADIEKMYRQVSVAKEDRGYQQILWRTDQESKLVVFHLNTVTYGTSSAPFLATRCLLELSNEIKTSSPKVSEIIQHDFYVDDLISGCEELSYGKGLCEEISEKLKTGCFTLRKWRSNVRNVLERVTTIENETDTQYLELGENENVKTLGLLWSSANDKLIFNINQYECNTVINKRVMLSFIARVFDPLGLLSPVTILLKIMLQHLWREKLSWDEALPSHLNSQWKGLLCEFSELKQIEIDRHAFCSDMAYTELHFFSDASEVAYGACVYVRCKNKKGEIFSNLLCAKSKVAPLKPTTIPRLELCAAHVSAKLSEKMASSLRITVHKRYYWADSKIVLGWLNSAANVLKPFVRNRVVEIQSLTEVPNWNYVPTGENPADLVTRGVKPSEIGSSSLWWHGPKWLREDEDSWPNQISDHEDLQDEARVSLTVSIAELSFPFERFSVFSRLKRCFAFILRFIKNCRSSKNERLTGCLSALEINDALKILIKVAQRKCFPNEYLNLSCKKELSKQSKLISLNPFLDDDSIIRVGGRLNNAEFDFNKKHPIILCSKHQLTKLLAQDYHKYLLHSGPQQLLASMREKYWVIGGRNMAKQIVRNCLKCYRFRANCAKPIMGQLPSTRFWSGFPFQVTGLDYAGPVFIKDKKGRGSRMIKGYICLFICFSTKCIHLELVSDLSSETFLLAFKRFIARRGKPSHIYSDNGTTFVGANRSLKEVFQMLKENNREFSNFSNNMGVEWHFGPPYAPNFGGLWEAGVKSTKYHLKRILGKAHVTFEEFSTILTQVEAILNSRPLTPLSTEPTDLYPLTPAHFLIGRPLTTTLEPDITTVPESRLSRYQHIEQLRQHFWARWRKDYIGELQQRSKWKNNEGQLKEGALVLVKEDNVPPLEWRLGRIQQLHPGKDNCARVATVITSAGTIKRAASKLCPLPVEAS